MIRFKELGFSSMEEYEKEFFDSLLLSNKTFDYFVDWRKVRAAVKKHLTELHILNSLGKYPKSERKEALKSLLIEYPTLLEVIPILIAERANKKARKGETLAIFDPELEKILYIDFSSSSSQNLMVITDFCEKVGILNLFDFVTDLSDYMLGIEVGLDTNARKNRSGTIFERLVQNKILLSIEGKSDLNGVKNDPHFSVYPGKKIKRHDLVIYKKEKPWIVIECNFYNVSGSKPNEITRSYADLFRLAQQKGIVFIWITDGPAWLNMRGQLKNAMQRLEWILNYSLLSRKLPQIIAWLEQNYTTS